MLFCHLLIFSKLNFQKESEYKANLEKLLVCCLPTQKIRGGSVGRLFFSYSRSVSVGRLFFFYI